MDDYTPHGYLDNPWHSARRNPSGVVRCVPAIGFAWHFPGLHGHYIRHQLYSAALRLAVYKDSRLLLTTADFDGAGVALVSRTHSKNIISFDWFLDGVSCSAVFFLASEHILCCRWTLHNLASRPVSLPLSFIAEYHREIGASETWDSGLVARAQEGHLSLLAYAEGEAFVCLSDGRPTFATVAPLLDDLTGALLGASAPLSSVTTLPSKKTASVFGATTLRAELDPNARIERLVVFARGASELAALRAARKGIGVAGEAYSRYVSADEQFRQRSPALRGDWPAHWRRGLVYDLQSVRAMVRPPQGAYRRSWDSMQAQSPRVVLAEAALDSVLIGYADPDLAKEVILGVFAGSAAPNIPCSREDGSFNMVADDGVPCGTAPEWCFPILCVDLIHRRTGDPRWQRRLYPFLARYLRWWLRHRVDADGWLHYHCGWESGQDESRRFGADNGASQVGHVRPVDLHASVAQAAVILSRWAGDLGRTASARVWQHVANEYAGKTRAFWHEGWFHDFDSRAGVVLPFRDVMQLAPLLAGVAEPAHLAALRAAYDSLPPHGIFPPLEWPPAVFTAVEAASAAGWHDIAGEIAFRVADRVYRAYDSRHPSSDDPLPGIASERWATSGSWGCEGYGWGAMSLLLVIRHVVGWRERSDGGVDVCPSLPRDWLVDGREFSIGPLRHRGADANLTYKCLEEGLEVQLEWRGVSPRVRVVGVDGREIPQVSAGRFTLPARNGDCLRIEAVDGGWK